MSSSLVDPVVRVYVLTCSTWVAARHRAVVLRARARGDDRGEGVVSAAIVVLIMAAIGALMWVGFRTMWTNIEQDTNDKISEIGS